jgi:hypothetical protein
MVGKNCFHRNVQPKHTVPVPVTIPFVNSIHLRRSFRETGDQIVVRGFSVKGKTS